MVESASEPNNNHVEAPMTLGRGIKEGLQGFMTGEGSGRHVASIGLDRIAVAIENRRRF